MLSIISKQTREKTNRQGKRHTRKNKQTTTKKKQQQQQGQCTHQMEPTFGDRKVNSFKLRIWLIFFFFERLLNLRQKEN